MSAKYYNINIEEMKSFLNDFQFKQIECENCNEIVFGKRVDQNNIKLTLRIYSGILSDGNSRPVGKDAIRLVLFTKNSQGKILKICGDKRVNRVENWRNNLEERITNWQTFFPKENCCKCGSVLVIRKNKMTKFLGCSEYPKCKFTKSLI